MMDKVKLIAIHVVLAVLHMCTMEFVSKKMFVLAIAIIAVLSIVATILCARYVSRAKGAYLISEILLSVLWFIGIMIVGRKSTFVPLMAIPFAVIIFVTHLVGQMLIVGLTDLALGKKSLKPQQQVGRRKP